MATCSICKTTSVFISQEIGVCLECIRKTPDKALDIALQAHRRSRKAFGLPETPPKAEDGKRCNICVNECSIPEGGLGYCGLRKNLNGRIVGVSPDEGKLSWYHDPLPTNCVADWVCAGGTGSGYPLYACRGGPEYGYSNLAVFFHACTFNCLYCQNWHFREQTLRDTTTHVESLVNAIDINTTCICYFGGDPTPQLPFALKASRMALRNNPDRILRICWETNGTMNKTLLQEMIELSLNTGGTIKFDLKAWDEKLHIALTGVTNQRTLHNFALVAERIPLRPEPPLLVASTLMVPGYIDENEVRGIARFIASLNPDIPYSLLAFYHHFYMNDLPLTSKTLAYRCLQVAKEEGLRNVRIGNIHLLQ